MSEVVYPRKRRKSPKRDHLLDTALQLFYAGGFHAIGIDTLLAEAGVAKMTLYNHFESKDDLIVAALERHAAKRFTKLSEALGSGGEDPSDRLEAFFDFHQNWFAEKDFKGCPFQRAIAEYPDQSSPVLQAVRKHKQDILEKLVEIANDLDASDSKELAEQFYFLAEGAITKAHLFKDPAAAAKAKAAALELAEPSSDTRFSPLPTHLL